MNFEFSESQLQIKEEIKKVLITHSSPTVVRGVLEDQTSYDKNLWRELGSLGFLGTAIAEEYGGVGAGYLELCVIAEEMGRALAPVPFASSIYFAAELLMMAGTEAQKQLYLPQIASGEIIACVAYIESVGPATPETIQLSAMGGVLNGTKIPVADGDIADVAIVVARTEPGTHAGGISLYLVDLHGEGVRRSRLDTIDQSRAQARIEFESVQAERLGAENGGWGLLQAALDKAAILIAFEQVGGAERAMEMARDYALERVAFGRPIGSFQAIKHRLADMYVAVTLARANAYFGAWTLSVDSAEMAVAAAVSRVSATEAYQFCSTENIQIHGAAGFTWEFDCHLYYRRSNLLALMIGGLGEWQSRLMDRMRNEVAMGSA